MGNVWLCRTVLSTDHQVYFVCRVTEKVRCQLGRNGGLGKRTQIWNFALGLCPRWKHAST